MHAAPARAFALPLMSWLSRGFWVTVLIGAVRPSDVPLEERMHPERGLWRAVRWPLLVMVLAGVGVAAVLDQTASREWALTIGGPALTVLLPVGLVWLVVAVIVYLVRRRGANRSE